MSAWRRRTHSPRATVLRRVCFQVHVWIALAIGLYVVMLSLTGSALVFRREFVQAASPVPPPIDEAARVLTADELRAAAARAYPGYVPVRIGAIGHRSALIEVSLQRGGETIDRAFHAYTGEDLGDPFPATTRALLWLAHLHDDLLMDRTRGRFWNGIGSALVTLLCITGLIIWWPGGRGWRRAMSVRWRAAWPRVAFDLHSAMGWWFFAMLTLWAVSGLYLSYPAPFAAAVDRIWGDAAFGSRPGDVALEWLVRLHFGRWRSHALKAVWVVIGLVPAAMFVTGAVMWWNRVVRRRREATVGRRVAATAAAPRGVE